ncbi:unnamed protein product [Trichobilharzia szidati]|nr:unnamed protein product [Trichobilharzia szidati]
MEKTHMKTIHTMGYPVSISTRDGRVHLHNDGHNNSHHSVDMRHRNFEQGVYSRSPCDSPCIPGSWFSTSSDCDIREVRVVHSSSVVHYGWINRCILFPWHYCCMWCAKNRI